MSPEQLSRERSRNQFGYSRAVHKISKRPTTTIAVVGLGYVGLPLAILAASRGYSVIGFDIDEVKIAQLEKREANFLSKEENEQFRKAENLVTTTAQRRLKDANVFIICVPTPVRENHIPDLEPLKSASAIVGRHLTKGSLVIIESTVNPGACEEVALPILKRHSRLSTEDFYFAHCPERINPGDEKWDVRNIPRVIGGYNKNSLDRSVKLYTSLIKGEIVPMNSIKEAEAVKMVENSFRDINIAFVNELAMAFDRAGIDIFNVIRGASTKPFGFMPHYPGCGVGGHCIPVDPYYLIRYGHRNGFEHRFLMTARRINNSMPLYTLTILEEEVRLRKKILAKRSLEGVPVALLGLSYKKDIPDLRESPALAIRKELEQRGADLRVYDPYVPGSSSVRTLDEALSGAFAVLIATDHALFQSLTPQQFEEYGVQVVVDGRNCLDKDSFSESPVSYRGIGRK